MSHYQLYAAPTINDLIESIMSHFTNHAFQPRQAQHQSQAAAIYFFLETFYTIQDQLE